MKSEKKGLRGAGLTVRIPRKEILEAAQLAGAPSQGRSHVLPAFQCMLLEATDGHIRLVGSDGEVWVERQISAEVEEPGALAVASRLFTDLLNSLPEELVAMEQPSAGSLKLSVSHSEYRVVGLPAEDFPFPSEISAEGSIRIPFKDFRLMVDSVEYAAADENQGRPILSGVLFKYDGERLTTVATDTHRLALRNKELPSLGDSVEFVLPKRALGVIKRLPVGDETELKITFSKRQLSVETEGARIVSQLLEDSYPQYERVIPKEFTRRWVFDAEQFTSALKRASILAKESGFRGVFASEGDKVLLKVRSEGVGEGTEEIDVVKEGEDTEIAFNLRYLLDAVDPIEGEGVVLEITESERPAVLRGSDSPEYFCVIMPMAL
jgi:DNA polymerase-3 subunit beta